MNNKEKKPVTVGELIDHLNKWFDRSMPIVKVDPTLPGYYNISLEQVLVRHVTCIDSLAEGVDFIDSEYDEISFRAAIL
jgi:hypothetical protein